MIESFRWYGPNDAVSLREIYVKLEQIVLVRYIMFQWRSMGDRRDKGTSKVNQAAGLQWGVVESVPVHEDIKQRVGNFQHYINNYKQTLKNLASCGIHTVCYNFMPVLDWTRTHLYMT